MWNCKVFNELITKFRPIMALKVGAREGGCVKAFWQEKYNRHALSVITSECVN
jgi:hypothetical protein